MSNFGYCLYGFYQNKNMPLPLVTGIDNVHKLEVISLDDLSAVISQVPLEEFGEDMLKENIQDIKWLEKHIRAYDEITRKLFEQTTFIPVRFGTIYLTKDRAKEAINTYKEQIVRLIKYLEGKVELGIKFFFDRGMLEGELLTSDLEVNDLYKKIQEEKPGKAHFLKKKLETLLDKKVSVWSDEIIGVIFGELKIISTDVQLLSLQPKSGNKQMFLNVACLTSGEKLNWFKEKVNGLMSCEKLASISCEITGPWPPYNFVRLESEKQDKESTRV